jgi:glycosyltransferase involved in cell wall biosynthesis
MRILVGIPEQGSQGGPAACEPPFIDELRRLGHQVDEEVYAFAQTSSTALRRITRVRETAKRLRQRLQHANFDIVHINTSFDTKALLRDAAVMSCLPSTGPKIFLKFHGSDAQLLKTQNPLLRKLGGYLLARADGIGLLSSEERANFLGAGVPEKKLFVVKNVVEESRQQPKMDFLRRWSLPKDRPLLLFVGRFILAKGLLDVITACGRLRDSGRQFLLLCLGDGPAKDQAEELVQRLDLQNYVRFFGYIPEEDTTGFYVNGDILLFPTYHSEGFPMVIFNAAAAALPIITTRIRAAADYLTEPRNCLWVEPRNPTQLAERIGRLLSQPEERQLMGTNNGLLAREFSAEIVTREYLESYQRIIQS